MPSSSVTATTPSGSVTATAQLEAVTATTPSGSVTATAQLEAVTATTQTKTRSNEDTPAAGTVTEPARTGATCHVLAIGDSLTDPKSGGGGYLEPLRVRCGCTVTNLAKGGAMVNQMRATALPHLEDSHVEYSHVIVFGGVNDLYSDLTAKRTVAKIERDLSLLYRAAKARGARVIAITVAPWGGFTRYFTELRWSHTLELNRWIREQKTKGSVDTVIDAEQLLSCGDPQRLCEADARPHRDGLHFGKRGHRRLGAALLESVKEIRCDPLPDARSGSD